MIPSDQKSNFVGQPVSGFTWRILIAFFLIVSISCRVTGSTPLEAQNISPDTALSLSEETLDSAPTTTPVPLPPTVAEIYPLSGSVISPDEGFSVTFSEPMDRVSVEAALQSQNSSPESLRWDSDTLLHLYPDPSLPPDSPFSITLADTAKAENGLTLLSPVEFTYKTPGELTLIDRFPSSAAVEVNPTAPLAVTFNQPIVPLSADAADRQAAFTLSPTASGKGEWRNSSTYVFYPEPPLSGGTTYSINLASDLKSLAGMPLALNGESSAWQFTTALPKIVSFTPDNTASIFLDDSITLAFNQPMDVESVQQNLTFQDEKGNRVAGEIIWNEDSSLLTFSPVDLLARDTSYTLILPQNTLSQGGASLVTDFSVDFKTVGFLNPILTNPPSSKQVNVSGGFASMTLTFNAPLANQNLDSLITITPEIDNLSIFVDSSRQNIFISGFFETSMDYQIRLSPEIRDRWETPLDKEVIFSVSTSPAQPSLTIPMLLVSSPTLFLTTQDKDLPVQATNIASVNISYTPVSLEDFLSNSNIYSLEDLSIQNEQWTRWEQPLDLTPNRGEAVNLALTPDGQALEAGLYYFQLSPKASVGNQPFNLSFLAVVSPIQLTVKRSADQVVVWAVDLRTMTPVEGQEVRLIDRENSVLGQAVTDKDGLCTISAPSGIDAFREYLAVLGEPGSPDFSLASTVWNNRISGWSFGISTNLSPEKPYAYIYSDRPIYRPGHTLYFRIVLRDAKNGRYSLPDLQQVNVKLWGVNNSQSGEPQPPVSTLTLPVSKYGTVDGSIQIPENSPTGSYTLVVEEVPEASLIVQVEEYRRPEIDLEVDFSRPEFQSDQEIQAVMNAHYFFGEAASNEKINWVLYAQSEYFSIPGGYTSGKQNAVWLSPYWWTGIDPVLGTYITEGTGTTDENGQLNISLTASELSSLDREQLQKLTLEATLQAEGEYPLSVRATARLHPADFYIGIRPDNWTGQAGSELGYSIRTLDWQKAPSGNHNLRAEFQKISWDTTETETWNPNGPSQEPQYTLVGSTDFSTDAEGRARLAFTPPEPGSYQIEITGGGAITQQYVWVSGESGGTWPNLPDQHIQLETDQDSYLPGDTANIFLPNPFSDNALALVSIERGQVMRTEVISLTKPSHILEIPLSAEDAPNVYVSVTLLGKLPNGIPDFRQGYQELKVAPTDQELQISLIPDQTQAQPGDAVDFTLEVKDASGQPVVGEFSLAVVDKATLSLVGGENMGIVDAFYGPQNLGVLNSLSLASYARRIALLPPGLGGGSGMVIPSIRENFPDTAYWNGKIETDSNGTAQVRITLPDNLTTWVADLRGLTEDSRVGEASQEITVSKDLLIRPQTPRFLVAGDRTRIAAIIHNNTDEDVSAKVSIQAKGLELEDASILQQISLPAKSQLPVYWWGIVKDTSEVELIFNAQAGDLEDSTRPVQGNIPVYAYSSPEVYGTTGFLAEAGERLEVIALPESYTPTGGSLKVELSQSLSASIIRDLDVLESASTDFTTAILSRLLSNLAAAQMLRDLGADAPLQQGQLEEEILKDINQIAASQDESGGWGWAAGSQSDPFITSYALLDLTLADEAGYLLDAGILQKAQDYLVSGLFRPTTAFEPWQLDRLAFQIFTLQRSGQSTNTADSLYNFREKMNPWAKALLAQTLYETDPQDARVATLLNDLKSGALVSSTGAHWEDDFNSYSNGSTANFSTAVVLYALSHIEPAAPLAADAVQYLIYHRKASGGWTSRYETAWVLLALTETLRGTDDLQADFAYSAALNETTLLQKSEGSSPDITADLATVSLSELNSSGANALRISREAGIGKLYYRAFLELHRPVSSVKPLNRGLTVTRNYYRDDPQCLQGSCEPLDEIQLSQYRGSVLVRVSLTAPEETAYLIVEDFIPAGMEIINPALETSQLGFGTANALDPSPDSFESNWGSWFFSQPQIYDNHIRWTAERLPAGTFELSYRLAPVQSGEYHVLPAHAYLAYYPDVEGSSAGTTFTILP